MLVLKGIEWNFQRIEVTSTKDLILKGKEVVGGDTHIKVSHKTTSRYCWWCRCIIMGKEIHRLPMEYTKGKYIYEGFFCSPSCAKAYALDESPKSRETYSKALSLLENMYSGEDIKKTIIPSPPWELLKDWGGVWSYPQYKEIMGKVRYTKNNSFHHVTFPGGNESSDSFFLEG